MRDNTNPSMPELENLVKRIKQGEAIVQLPPGYSSFVAVIMLLIVSIVTLFAPLLTVIGSEWEISTRVTVDLVFICGGVLIISTLAFLITRGKQKLQRWFILLSSTVLLTAVFVVIIANLFSIESLQFRAPVFYICIFTSSVATYLSQSSRYRAVAYFYYLIHKKTE